MAQGRADCLDALSGYAPSLAGGAAGLRLAGLVLLVAGSVLVQPAQPN
jgi:hypothetical protein